MWKGYWKMKKKYAALILGMMLGIAVTGCSNNTEEGKQTAQTEEHAQEESITGEVKSTDEKSITVILTNPSSAGEEKRFRRREDRFDHRRYTGREKPGTWQSG